MMAFKCIDGINFQAEQLVSRVAHEARHTLQDWPQGEPKRGFREKKVGWGCRVVLCFVGVGL